MPGSPGAGPRLLRHRVMLSARRSDPSTSEPARTAHQPFPRLGIHTHCHPVSLAASSWRSRLGPRRLAHERASGPALICLGAGPPLPAAPGDDLATPGSEPLLQDSGGKWLIAQNDVRGLLRQPCIYTIDLVTYFLVIVLARTILGSKPSRMLSDGIWRARLKNEAAEWNLAPVRVGRADGSKRQATEIVIPQSPSRGFSDLFGWTAKRSGDGERMSETPIPRHVNLSSGKARDCGQARSHKTCRQLLFRELVRAHWRLGKIASLDKRDSAHLNGETLVGAPSLTNRAYDYEQTYPVCLVNSRTVQLDRPFNLSIRV